MFNFQDSYPITFTPSKGSFHELHSPNDGKTIAKLQYIEEVDLSVLYPLVKAAQKKIEHLSIEKRIEILLKVSNYISEDLERLAYLISLEGGKPLKDAKVEVERASHTFKLCAEELINFRPQSLPMDLSKAGRGHTSVLTRDPIGPVLAISAFNHPLNLLAHQVGPAFAAGNTVVIKPASTTPMSAYELHKIFIKAGLSHEDLFVVLGETKLIEKMATSPLFSFVTFIGSAKVGWDLRRKIANGTRISLEHGGQAAAILREDSDLDRAIPDLVKGSFYHAGQVCISTQRIFVHKNIAQKFLSGFIEATKKLKVGSATLIDTDVGPLIKSQEVDRISEWINLALTDGAKKELGFEISGNQKQFLSPTILSEVPRTSKIMQEEVFGPVVCVNTYQDEEELVEYLNTNPYKFEMALYTKDLKVADELALKLQTMTLVINNHTAYRVDWMPFGGHGLSGLGMGGVKYAIEEMTRLKQVITKN